jgi:hypothetical protein
MDTKEIREKVQPTFERVPTVSFLISTLESLSCTEPAPPKFTPPSTRC